MARPCTAALRAAGFFAQLSLDLPHTGTVQASKFQQESSLQIMIPTDETDNMPTL